MNAKKLAYLVLIFGIISFPLILYGQTVGKEEIFPVLVRGPVLSRTAFTNWMEIEATYTVGYINGYEIIMDQIMPNSLDFGTLKLDPAFENKLDIRNKRAPQNNENYFDVVYHLRYMGEKKGDIEIPGQTFAYRAITGDTSVKYFTTRPFLMVYNSVLTKDADDIKEDYDQGSFASTASYWGVGGVVMFLVGIVGAIALVTTKRIPIIMPRVRVSENVSVVEKAKTQSLESIFVEIDKSISSGDMRALGNGLNDLLRICLPTVKPGMFSGDEEMINSIASVSDEWERDRLEKIRTHLALIEDYLFSGKEGSNTDLSKLKTVLRDLSPRSLYSHRRKYNTKKAIKEFFRRKRQ